MTTEFEQLIAKLDKIIELQTQIVTDVKDILNNSIPLLSESEKGIMTGRNNG